VTHRPRVHGNGFIQLDLTPHTRLHVWGDPRIPHQSSPTPIHDHVFDFHSRIILGTVGNQRYSVLQGQDPITARDVYSIHSYDVHRARREGDTEDTQLVSTGQIVSLVRREPEWFGCGESYYMRAGELHESLSRELAVTVITKSLPAPHGGQGEPRIFVPMGTRPDNDFRREAPDEDLLWTVISDALLKARWFDPWRGDLHGAEIVVDRKGSL